MITTELTKLLEHHIVATDAKEDVPRINKRRPSPIPFPHR
jgi:hypothetical protein